MCASGAGQPDPQFPASAASPFVPGCDGVAATGTVYENAEVEPMLAVNPVDPDNLVGVWQQDRWSNGGARGLLTGYSHDGGRTWARTAATFSRCTGGNAANGGDYERATDPWVVVRARWHRVPDFGFVQRRGRSAGLVERRAGQPVAAMAAGHGAIRPR